MFSLLAQPALCYDMLLTFPINACSLDGGVDSAGKGLMVGGTSYETISEWYLYNQESFHLLPDFCSSTSILSQHIKQYLHQNFIRETSFSLPSPR